MGVACNEMSARDETRVQTCTLFTFRVWFGLELSSVTHQECKCHKWETGPDYFVLRFWNLEFFGCRSRRGEDKEEKQWGGQGPSIGPKGKLWA